MCSQNCVVFWNQQVTVWNGRLVPAARCDVMKQGRVMLEFLFSVLAALRVFLRSRSDTALEVLALRQQVAVLKRQRPRPTVTRLDRFFWTTLRHLWPRWSCPFGKPA